jgi:hypothetical protein
LSIENVQLSERARRSPYATRGATALCALLIATYAVVAWSAVSTKSPTFDEPYHALSAWVQLHRRDYRIDNEDPPLWQYWASLPNGPGALSADFDGPVWRSVPQQLLNQWYWGVQTLYLTNGNDADRLVMRCRAMMLVVAVAVAAAVAAAAGRLGGPVAAVVAAGLFCLDPNFLAHGPLMKNDVAFAASAFAAAAAVWAMGRRVTLGSVAAVLLAVAVTLTVKFSGCLIAAIVPALLLARAMLPAAWSAFGRDVSTRRGRLAVAIGLSIMVAVAGYVGIWAAYGFRFRPTPAADVWLNLTEITDQVRTNRMLLDAGGDVPPGTRPPPGLPWVARAALAVDRHGLLPQPFVAGFLFTYANSIVRPAYLCGHIRVTGWWWYFPFAMAVKTPLATIAAAVATLAWAVRRGRAAAARHAWTILCLTALPAVLLGTAMVSHLDIGLRHVLAVYPFGFVAIGWAVAHVWGRRWGRVAVASVGLLLAAESLSAWPDYLPFFNVAARQALGGRLALLGDSNLDWGQDLLLLVDWQREHPGTKLYLSYFGYADPAAYGIRYVPLPGGYEYGPRPVPIASVGPGVVAISASNLQGTPIAPELRPWYAAWAKRTPRAVLGGSIYLFDNPPP